MRCRIVPTFLPAVALVLLFAAPVAADPSDPGRPFSLVLTPEAEVPPATDPDAAGTAKLRLNAGQEELCFEIETNGVEDITASHVHRAPVGVAGPIVIPLTMAFEGTASGCVPADRDLAVDILREPAAFYVNVHNAEFPSGVLRGQLG